MQQARQELRDIFSSRVHASFVRARICLRCARLARRRGDTGEFHKWLNAARVLRGAAAGWRQRAQRIAPVLVCLLWCLAGCAQAPSLPVTVDLTALGALVRPGLRTAGLPSHPVRFTLGRARGPIVWASDNSEVVAVDCSMTSLSEGLVTLETRVDIRELYAGALRRFLTQNGVPVATPW
jgi:hypothetical protein